MRKPSSIAIIVLSGWGRILILLFVSIARICELGSKCGCRILQCIGVRVRLRRQVDCRGDHVVRRYAMGERFHQGTLIRLSERETVEESLLPEVLAVCLRFAQRHAETSR